LDLTYLFLIQNLKFKIQNYSVVSDSLIYCYQLLFFTPGNSPLLANSLKQILQISKARRYPCFLPQRQQRRTIRVENLGFFSALAFVDVFAIFVVTE